MVHLPLHCSGSASDPSSLLHSPGPSSAGRPELMPPPPPPDGPLLHGSGGAPPRSAAPDRPAWRSRRVGSLSDVTLPFITDPGSRRSRCPFCCLSHAVRPVARTPAAVLASELTSQCAAPPTYYRPQFQSAVSACYFSLFPYPAHRPKLTAPGPPGKCFQQANSSQACGSCRFPVYLFSANILQLERNEANNACYSGTNEHGRSGRTRTGTNGPNKGPLASCSSGCYLQYKAARQIKVCVQFVEHHYPPLSTEQYAAVPRRSARALLVQ